MKLDYLLIESQYVSNSQQTKGDSIHFFIGRKKIIRKILEVLEIQNELFSNWKYLWLRKHYLKTMSLTAVLQVQSILQYIKLSFVYYFMTAINHIKLLPFFNSFIKTSFFLQIFHTDFLTISLRSLLAQNYHM